MLRPGGYLIVGMSDTISPQVADWLHLIPVSQHISQGMWQYLPPDWKPMRCEPEHNTTSTTTTTTTLPLLTPRSRHSTKTINNQDDNESLSLEDYSDLSHFLIDGLHEKPPEIKHNYITAGSESILARIDYANRPPLHHCDKHLPYLKLRDAREAQREAQDENRWNRTMTENTFGGEGASEFYIKDQERLAKKRENRKQFIPEDELNQVVDRMAEAAFKKEERRKERMQKMWKDERKKMKRKRKKEKSKRRRQLKKFNKKKRNPEIVEEEEEEEGKNTAIDVVEEGRIEIDSTDDDFATKKVKKSSTFCTTKNKQKTNKKLKVGKRKKKKKGVSKSRPATAPVPNFIRGRKKRNSKK